jgi:hypothetical protein
MEEAARWRIFQGHNPFGVEDDFVLLLSQGRPTTAGLGWRLATPLG